MPKNHRNDISGRWQMVGFNFNKKGVANQPFKERVRHEKK
jgi:hypothetical protein